MRVKCAACGRIVGAFIPKGGDGSLWLPRRHNCGGWMRNWYERDTREEDKPV